MIDKKNILLLLALGILFRIIFANLIPPFTGNDEPAHLRYAQHILSEKRLPNANLYHDEGLAGNEYFQPPAYYTLAASMIFNNTDPFIQLQILRLLAIILWLITFYFAYKTLLVLKLPKSYSISILAFVSLLPTYIVNSSTVTNDALAIPLATVIIYYMILWLKEKYLTYKKLSILAFLSALTILVKLNGFALVPGVILAIFYCEKGINSRFLTKTVVYSFLTFVLIFWWFFYNNLTYNNWFGPINISTATFAKVPFNLYKIYLVLRGGFATFWSAYGPANEIRLPIFVYFGLLLITSYGVIGAIVYSIKTKLNRASSLIGWGHLTILLTVFIFNFALLLALNIGQLQPLGRYLFISLLPISIFFVIGIFFLTPVRLRKFIPHFLIILLIGLNILGINTLVHHYS